MTVPAEERKIELVDRVAQEAAAKVSPPQAEPAREFVRKYFELVAPDDVIYTAPETLLGEALSLWEYGVQRDPGTASVRIFNPKVEEQGWTLEHTIVEIVNDDMPFLVDSITAELNHRERNIHLFVHPVITVWRDPEGRRTDPAEASEREARPVAESYMHIEFDQETGLADLQAVQTGIERVLADVRVAVADWQTMRQKLIEALDEIDRTPPPIPSADLAEAKEFLRWMADDHYVFLGYRRYGFATHDGNDFLEVDPASGLGILREVLPWSTQRSRTPFSTEFSRFARRKELLIVAKANNRSTIHRPVHMDRVSIKRFDASGNLIGEDRFLGLFTSAAYSRSVRSIPLLRRKVSQTIERAGLSPNSHNAKALMQILETFPRDELFQITDEELFHISLGVLQLQERQRIALFTRKDVFERFVSCLVYVPRDRFATELHDRIEKVLERSYEGTVTASYSQVTDSPLARWHFIVKTTPGHVPAIDPKRVEAYIAEAARTWADHLREALIRQKGEETGLEIHRRYSEAFPSAYREDFSAEDAIEDIPRIENATLTGEPHIDLYHRPEEGRSELRCKIIHTGTPLALSEIVPRLENMGLKVELAVPYDVWLEGRSEPVRIRDFDLNAPGFDFDVGLVKEKFQNAFGRVWKGEAEDDGFNRLVLCAGLAWHEVVILRAYCKYLRQTGIAFSEVYMQQTLAHNPAITELLVRLFETRFDPSLSEADPTRAEIIRRGIAELLEDVSNLDEDRIIRRYINVIESTIRTNYYQRDTNGARKPYLSFKFDSLLVDNLPLPRPMFEIFVYSPRMEGIHLRGGRVARGGIRWSDRREDFRTEILGLMKAQTVKNVVIVPVGAKGGFVVKHPPVGGTREELLQEGIECYRTLIRGMLDITDNLVAGEVVPPADVVRRDSDDTYLVVAADKGTATFSDIANALSADYRFWLGDAFASGGSVGYDHKKMGITARGAWEAVKRHFRELGTNIQQQDFTVVGVGDMSGDVFGNGMLLSEHIRLIGAFNHLHIFVDPDPDPARSFEERKRLFGLERSSWSDYDTAVLSPGGAVFDRRAKSITVSEQVQARFDLTNRTLPPHELAQAILKARADLLWFGGIGTFVKASEETHASARDRANEALRIDATELRVHVVGEGANLGLTQRARIEFALLNGAGEAKINTDAIDNSAGVDTSDHEVNIKILVDAAVVKGALSPDERLALLTEMTGEVAELVLRDNFQQTQAISVAAAQGSAILDQQSRLMRMLERAGKLDRALEALPDDETVAERHAAHIGLTRPEIAVLLAYAKIALYQDILSSELPDNPLLVEDLILYFPTHLRDRFRDLIQQHRLRREIIATFVTNNMVNRVGPTFVSHIMEETGRSAPDIARAYTICRDVFDLRKTWEALSDLELTLPAALVIEKMISIGGLLERSTLWLLRSGYDTFDISAYVEEFRPRVAALLDRLETVLPETDLAGFRADVAKNEAAGLPAPLARKLASMDVLGSAFDIVRIARAGHPVEDVAGTYFGVGARLDLERLRGAARAIIADTSWQKTAVAGVIDDIFASQGELTARVLTEAATGQTTESIETWLARRPAAIGRYDQVLTELRSATKVDVAALSVMARLLRFLAES